jgi:hypothetical protein
VTNLTEFVAYLNKLFSILEWCDDNMYLRLQVMKKVKTPGQVKIPAQVPSMLAKLIN